MEKSSKENASPDNKTNQNENYQNKKPKLNNQKIDDKLPTTSTASLNPTGSESINKINNCYSKHNNPFIHLYYSYYNDKNEFNDEYAKVSFFIDYFI